ncbi:hypothetical protein L6452_04968 [Arctium lappa]|uniref:Uncharacterized protein n=1 Tax=Arctium lappa TaxID=4217 RepID=A0ACB9EFD5_ARCLA|nr:hypothetical protein L6452_04968 [Arctium lappa]
MEVLLSCFFFFFINAFFCNRSNDMSSEDEDGGNGGFLVDGGRRCYAEIDQSVQDRTEVGRNKEKGEEAFVREDEILINVIL